ncbi:MAG: hypothetical protein HP491_17245 [Nitrospira sp.]|nr:hypothetical protein [Nitrospira sp.]MBH0183581.1 hypothetical protein [Nitrospira sp.]MBH0187077.1 hypothetical protein [Nitrospira sp.]
MGRIMPPRAAKELRKQKPADSLQKQESAVSEQEPVHCQPVSPCDDLHVHIAQRAFELQPSGKISASNATRRNLSGSFVLFTSPRTLD